MGLPLAVVLIAGLLKKDIMNLDWWRQIGERLDKLVAIEDCKGILEESYKQLPDFLKPCFLYFGSFPEDEKIRVNDLIILWISEGFIEKHETKSLEVVANEYLMDLVGRSLVIALRRSSVGRIKTCIVHDLLREFCLAKGKEENVFQVFDGNKDSNNLHYRICIQDNCWSSFLRHENGSAAPFVHSLLPFPKDRRPLYDQILEPKYIRSLATHFRFLQVLFLRSNVYVGAFPEAITELVLLKCLIIACDLKSVPPSVKKLENLETLIFEHHFSVYSRSDFPLMAVLEMQKLRHLFVRGVCNPTGFENNMHPISRTLRTFSCTDLLIPYNRSEMFFTKLPNVQTLKCQIKRAYSSLEEPKLILKFDYLSRLESLRVIYQTLGYQYSSSFELQFPYSLKKLHLLDFRFPWSSMPAAISRLPNLEVLKLDGGIFGKTWNVEDYEFQTLKFLRLSYLGIEEFNASDDSFPCLQHFAVDGCEDLQEIPIRFASISTLKIIEVDPDLESSARYIQEEQKDLGNDLEVRISVGFRFRDS
ncbi:hypothetical protein M9H77_10618 [Catharanthus roseus]|uniref:Uncharacterized protein n=1 Tax=Catharanthus roseus TaxID=4058 RepID=A0ACC0BCA4_CATRO|nr:hypothetical protein M9H77_10618 [Catharanthus roseus]